MPNRLLVLAVGLSLVTHLGGPTYGQPAAASPTTTLDFIATTNEGRLPSLSSHDVSLKVGGRQQRIQSLQAITGPAFTRHVVLLVDEATLYNLEPVVKDAVDKLLASLAPGDLVSFFSTRHGGTRTSLTPNHKKIADAVATMTTGPGVLWTCQNDLIRMIGQMAGDLPRGRSSSIAVISRGHPEGPSPAGDSGGGSCTPRREELRQLDEAVGVAQVNLHLFTVDETNRSWGFDNIAANAGATSGLLTWSSHDGLARAIHSAPGYYRLTFEWNAPTDRAQRVELRTKDKSLKIRTSSWIRAR